MVRDFKRSFGEQLIVVSSAKEKRVDEMLRSSIFVRNYEYDVNYKCSYMIVEKSVAMLIERWRQNKVTHYTTHTHACTHTHAHTHTYTYRMCNLAITECVCVAVQLYSFWLQIPLPYYIPSYNSNEATSSFLEKGNLEATPPTVRLHYLFGIDDVAYVVMGDVWYLDATLVYSDNFKADV